MLGLATLLDRRTMSDNRTLFSIPDYRRIFSATLVSSLGDGVMLVALPLLAASVTDSSRAIAWVLGVSRMPLLLLSLDSIVSSVESRRLARTGIPWVLAKLNGATVADRSDARTVMLGSDFVRFGVLAALAVVALVDRLSLGAIYVTAFVLGLFEIPFSAASQRMFPETVPDRLLPIANGRITAASTSGEQFLGPALGGLFVKVGLAAPVIGDALSFLGSAAFLRRLPALPPEPRTDDQRPTDMAEAWKWLRGSAPLRSATALISVLGFAQIMTLALLVQIGRDTLNLDDRAVGFFVAAIAVGNLIGTLFADRVFARLGYARNLVVAGVVVSISYAIAGLSTTTAVVVGAFILEGIVIMFGQVAYNVLRQRLIPAALRGRVFSLTRVAIRGVSPFGALLAGEIAERRDPSAAVFAAALIAGAGVFVFGPDLRHAFRSLE